MYDPQSYLVSTLKEAVSYYIAKMVDKNIYLQYTGHVKPVYEKMDKRYFFREYEANDKDNEYNIPVRKQAETLWISDRPFSIILRQETKNALGLEDFHYYYILFRKKLSYKWSRTLGLDKYARVPGIYLPLQVLRHIDREKVIKQATIVLVLGDGRTFESDYTKIREYYSKIRYGKMINEWGIVVTAVPVNNELFEEII